MRVNFLNRSIQRWGLRGILKSQILVCLMEARTLH